jgi:hypothetical protein
VGKWFDVEHQPGLVERGSGTDRLQQQRPMLEVAGDDVRDVPGGPGGQCLRLDRDAMAIRADLEDLRHAVTARTGQHH